MHRMMVTDARMLAAKMMIIKKKKSVKTAMMKTVTAKQMSTTYTLFIYVYIQPNGDKGCHSYYSISPFFFFLRLI